MRDAGKRKENNQFHESLHAQLYLHSLLIYFHFPVPLKTKLKDVRNFSSVDTSPPGFKNTEVRCSGENDLIHCLRYLRRCSLTHTHSHTQKREHTFLNFPPPFTFYSDLSRSSCARVSKTCCFRLPEQMDIRSAFCFSSQTNDLPSPCPSLPPAFIYSSITKPPPAYLPHCLGDISESKHPLLAWIAISCLVTSVFAFLTSVNPSHREKGNYSRAT